jgi:GLPGLI family protein
MKSWYKNNFWILKFFFIISLTIFLNSILSSLKAQNLYATYNRKVAPYNVEQAKSMPLPILEYIWHLYIKNNKVYSYFEPLYLEKYPDGIVKYKPDENSVIGQQILSTEKKQVIQTIDFDTLITRTFISAPPGTFNGKHQICDGSRSYFNFIRPFQPWLFLNETKTIQGIECQHAKLYNRENELEWDLWFAPGIPIPGATLGLYDLPGLMVEGIGIKSNTSYSLLSYSTEINIPDETFWPECFDGNFTFRGTLKPYKSNKTQ